MAKPADEFIKDKNTEWERDREQERTIWMKDIGREGRHQWRRKAWTFLPCGCLPECVFVVERLEYVATEGIKSFPGGSAPGDIEYRFGYYTVGQNGRVRDRWTWGQFCPIIPADDLPKLLDKARTDGTILRATTSAKS